MLPFGNGIYAPIAAEDQGRVIANILADPAKHAGKTYPLYGPVEMSQYDIAKTVSEVLGKEITYVPIEIEDFKTIMEANPAYTPWFIQHVGAIAQDCRDGIMSGLNNNVETITGKKPLPLKDYVVKNKTLFTK